MSKNALVIGGTKKDWENMAIFLLNVKTVMPNFVEDFVVFHNGITKKQQELMSKIGNVKFVRYKPNFSKIQCWLNKSVRYFSPMVFCKYECLRLLADYDCVIWSDYDVVIKSDVSEILDTQFGFSVIINGKSKLKDNFFSSYNRNKDIKKFDLDSDGITTPLFVMKKSIGDFLQYYDWCYKNTRRFFKHLYLPEQAIITMMVQNFKIKYGTFDVVKYCSHPKDDDSNVKILHAYGQPKFWNGLQNNLWNSYFKEWQKIKESI